MSKYPPPIEIIVARKVYTSQRLLPLQCYWILYTVLYMLIYSAALSVTWIVKCNTLVSTLVPKWSSTSMLYVFMIHFRAVSLLTVFLDFFISPLKPTSRPLELGGSFHLFFLEKILGDSRFFSNKFTKMGYLFELPYFMTILKKMKNL